MPSVSRFVVVIVCSMVPAVSHASDAHMFFAGQLEADRLQWLDSCNHLTQARALAIRDDYSAGVMGEDIAYWMESENVGQCMFSVRLDNEIYWRTVIRTGDGDFIISQQTGQTTRWLDLAKAERAHFVEAKVLRGNEAYWGWYEIDHR